MPSQRTIFHIIREEAELICCYFLQNAPLPYGSSEKANCLSVMRNDCFTVSFWAFFVRSLSLVRILFAPSFDFIAPKIDSKSNMIISFSRMDLSDLNFVPVKEKKKKKL